MDRFDWIELDRGAPADAPGGHRLRRQPHDAASHLAAAREMREHGFLKSAAEHYEKALGLDEHHQDTWLELIDTLVRIGEYAQADARSREAVENYRLVRPFFAARALVLGHLGRFEEAFGYSQTAVTYEAPHWYAFCIHGELVLRWDVARRQDALGFYDAALECAVHRWEPPFLAGWAFLEAGLPAVAAAMFAEAAHHNPRAPVCWLGLADSFRALRLYDQALFYYERVLELEPHHEAALRRKQRCTPLLYGLMNILRPTGEHRWARKFRDALNERAKKETYEV